MEVPSESFHWSSWDSRTCYPRRSNVGPGERFLRAQGWVMKLCSLVLESHANEKLRFQASKHATHDSRRVQTRLSSSLFSCLQPGLDWTRLFMSLTAGAGTRCMSLLPTSPNHRPLGPRRWEHEDSWKTSFDRLVVEPAFSSKERFEGTK